MKFQDYYRSLRGVERREFADRAGTSQRYIEVHLMAGPDRRKIPRRPLIESLAEATQGACTVEDVLAHFFELAA